MRILIIEEALQHGDGHWMAYIGTLADGLRAEGDQVDVLVHRQATDEVVARVGGTRWLRRNSWRDPGSAGIAGGLGHNFRFYQDVARWLDTHPPYDWILCLTMRPQHLLAAGALARFFRQDGQRWLLLFVQGFGVHSPGATSPSFPRSPSRQFARGCFRILAQPVLDGRVVLAAETAAMQRELNQFSGLPVRLFPHPVPPAPNASSKALTRPGSSGATVIAAPGFARHEKGTDLLQDAILRLFDRTTADAFRFVLQWKTAFALPDGTAALPSERLSHDPRVDFRNTSLGPGEYEAFLAESDFVILPYRSSSYHNRLSRVAIEAATRGIPLIYTRDTWTAELAALAGGGTAIGEESAEAVAEAIAVASRQLAPLTEAARSGATAVAERHSARGFRQCLLQP